MSNPFLTIELSKDQKHFFCANDREINVNSNIETEKHLTLVPRSGIPHGTNLDLLAKPTALASSHRDNVQSYNRKSNFEKKEWTPTERRNFIENKIKEAVVRLNTSPEEIFHICVSVYRPKVNKPERLTVNIDFIFDKGTKPFKTSADCVSRSRIRELTANIKTPWQGYDYARACLREHENLAMFAGKLKNRKQHKALIPQRIIPRTVVIVDPINNHLQIIIDEIVYKIDLIPETNAASKKFFQLRGEYQNIIEKEWDI
jgi:hypothetical protein